MKLFITGGHLTPAIAVIEEIEKQYPHWEIVFVGRKFAMEGKADISAEYRVITDMRIRFLSIITGRLQRSFTRYTFFSLAKFIIGFVQSMRILVKEKPDGIISFGGYVAMPLILGGFILRIPSITHEQTTTLGFANQKMVPFVKKICITYKQLVEDFHVPSEKTVYTGLPLRRALFEPPRKPLFAIPQKYPLIYVAGGATGSESINSIVAAILPELLSTYTIIHQTGYAQYSIFQKKKETLPTILAARYHAVAYIPVTDLAWIYKQSKLYVGRSGANTVGELAALGKVAIFMPLPWAAQNEQEKNAEILVDAGSAVILSQDDTTAEQLLKTIRQVFEMHTSFQHKAAEFSKTIPRDGASRMVAEIASVCR